MNKYEILDIIDEGAYGIVWKAVNKQTQEIGNGFGFYRSGHQIVQGDR